jgi:predicted TIM-barrel fold metal-dependent hydrolase
MTDLQLTAFDRDFYAREIRGYLPSTVIDCHSHVWTRDHLLPTDEITASRSASWAASVAEVSPIEDLERAYRELFPDQRVTPVLMPGIETTLDGVLNNAYVSKEAAERGYPSLALTKPELSAIDFERLIESGGFLGCKPYLNFAPAYLPAAEIRIFDFLPHHHLEVLNRRGWIAMLHIPRPGRLGDEVNLAQLEEIARRYPHARIIVTHIGRAYDPAQIGRGMEVLARSTNFFVDITANTNAEVMERLFDSVGSERVMFGSDLPIFLMRAHRKNVDGSYVNVVPAGMYGDVSSDPTMEDGADFDTTTLLLYEEIAAAKQATDALSLSSAEVTDLFYTNAARLFGVGR